MECDYWYINYEADLNYFADTDGDTIKNAYMLYIAELTRDLTEISNNGLNAPEFFWSPLFGKRYRDVTVTVFPNPFQCMVGQVKKEFSQTGL